MRLKAQLAEYNILSIVCYLRKSRQDIERERRTGEDTLTEQTELMNNVMMGIELPYDMRLEIGSGENISGRPVFQEVLNDLNNDKYQAIAVKELSRLSRGSYGDAEVIINTIVEKRIIIITPYKIYDPRNNSDMKQIRFELFLAREEYEMIKERMVGARYTYASQGKWVAGKAPYGYKYNKQTQRLEINEEQAQVVRLIYDLFLNGLDGVDYSYQAIKTYLTNSEHKTARGKSAWSVIQVKTLLESITYTGTIKFRTTEKVKNGKKIPRPESEHIVVENAHEPIIDKETWLKVQEKIKGKIPSPRNPLDFSPHELAGVCTCSKCGARLIRNAQRVKYKKKDGTESVYTKEFVKCLRAGCMSVKYRDVESAILDTLSELIKLDDSRLQQIAERQAKDQLKVKNKDTKQSMVAQLLNKEKELKKRLDFIFEKYESGIYSDELFLERKKVIEEEMAALEKNKNELQGLNVKENLLPPEQIKIKITDFLEAYNSRENKEDKNEILRTVFDKVEVTVTKRGYGRIPAEFYITPYFRFDIFVNNP